MAEAIGIMAMLKVCPSRKFTSCAKRESKTVLQITGEVWASVRCVRVQVRGQLLIRE